MKKSLIVVVLLGISLASVAQTIIPKAGITMAKMTLSGEGSEMVDLQSIIGLSVGAGVNFPINEIFSIQPELTFVQKGFAVKTDFNFTIFGVTESYKIDARTTMNYLEVPVLAKATFGEATKFYINAGPSIGMGLGGKYRYEEEWMTSDGTTTESGSEKERGKVKFGDGGDENSDDLYVENRFDVGFQVGAGILVKEKFMFDLRYGIGFTNVSGGGDGEKSQNRVFQFTVGMPLNLK